MMKPKPRSRLPDFKELTHRISFVQVLEHFNLMEQMDPHGDQLRSVCPIHEGAENRHSFSVNTVKNCFKCFSCDAQGNILDFVAAMKDCNKVQAGRKLEKWFPKGSSKATPKPERVQEKKSSANSDQQKIQPEEVNLPLTFALTNLDTQHPYLSSRVQPETIERFGLGFCSKGLMAGRLVVPIHNEQGELIAYAGRALDKEAEEAEGKYKLPPHFKKRYVLYNLHRIVEAIKAGEPLILVEGFFDVFRLYELGYHNVVALMGSELTIEQEGLLKTILTPLSRVALLFDNDKAGIKCRNEAGNKLSKWCFIKVVNLPEGITQPDQLKENIEIV